MDTVKNIALIETTLTRRGEGTFLSPIRVITQYWTQDGTLVIESDPFVKTVTPEKVLKLRIALNEKLGGDIEKTQELISLILNLLDQ